VTYAIDTEGTVRVGSALLTSGAELRDCGTAFAYAGGLAQRGVAADHAALAGAVERFVATHLAAIEGIASATSALARDLSWAAQSTHQVELSVAADLGRQGAIPPLDSAGGRV
jgi:hypothetical protein